MRRLAREEGGEEVGAVVLLGGAGLRVADDDARAVDGGGDAVGHRLAHEQLGLVLGLLVVVAELLAHLEGVLGELALVAAADVAGADVLQPPQVRLLAAEGEHVGGAADVDPAGDLRRDGEVVDGREVPHLLHLVEAVALDRAEAEPGDGDVALDEPDAARRVRVGDLELLDPGPGEHRVLRLHEADRVGAGPAGEQPGEQGGTEEAGEPGHEQLGHANVLCARSRGLAPVGVPAPSPDGPATDCSCPRRRPPDRRRPEHVDADVILVAPPGTAPGAGRGGRRGRGRQAAR